MSIDTLNLRDWTMVKTEGHNDTELFREKYSARILDLLNEMEADGFASVITVNVSCAPDGMGDVVSSSRLDCPERLNARFLQLNLLANNDSEAAAAVEGAQALRAIMVTACTRH